MPDSNETPVGAGPAAAPSPAVAGQSFLDASLARVLGETPAAQPVVQAAPGEPPPAPTAPDPLDAILSELPADDPARRAVQALRSQAGRTAAAQRELNELRQRVSGADELERQTATLMLDAALAGANPYQLALKYGLDPEETQAFLATVEQARGNGAAPSGAASRAAAGPTAPSAPVDVSTAIATLRALGDPNEIARLGLRGSDGQPMTPWTKPYFDAQAAIMEAQNTIMTAQASLRMAETPAERQQLETIIASETRRLQGAHMSAIGTFLKPIEGALQYVMQQLEERFKPMQPLLERWQQAVQSEQQQAAEAQQTQQFVAGLAADAIPDGEPGAGASLYGPQGWNIFATDGAGNLLVNKNGGVVPTEVGKRVMPMVLSLMEETGMAWTKSNFHRALQFVALQAEIPSDDGAVPAQAGVALAGGDPTLPVNGAPGSGEARQSNNRSRVAAVKMF